MRRSPISFILVSALVVLAACGGGGSSKAAGITEAPTTVVTAPATSAEANAADQARVRAAVLTSADVGAAFTSRPHTLDPDADKKSAEVVACLGLRNTVPDRTARADSDDFSQVNLTVASSASAYATQADVTSDAKAFTSPRAHGCVEKLLREAVSKNLPPGAAITSLVLRVAGGAAPGRPNQVGRVTATITVSVQSQQGTTVLSQQGTIAVDAVYFTGRRIEAELDVSSFGGAGTALPPGLVDRLAAVMSHRVAAA